MTAQKKREILTGGIAALLIVCAVAARIVTRGHQEAAYFLPVSLLRSLIYIGLMTWWGVSLWQRIVQTQVRRYLAATAALCVFWLSIRTVKFFFAAIRYLWYGYDVPMLFNELVLSDKLFEHCAEIDEAARNRMELIVPELVKRNGVTEQLKAENQMEWVRQMNACKAQAEEVVKFELIYD